MSETSKPCAAGATRISKFSKPRTIVHLACLASLANLADITRYALYQHAAFCIVNQTALAWAVRSHEHHGTRSNRFRITHRHRLHPDLPPSGLGTTSNSPTLITVHKALGSRVDRVRDSRLVRPLQKARTETGKRPPTSTTSPRERIASAQATKGNPSLIGPKHQVDVASSSNHASRSSGTTGLANMSTW